VEAEIAPASIVNTFPTEKVSAASSGAKPRDGIEVYNLEMDVLPLDNDLFTLFSPYAFLRGWYHHDLTVVDEVRTALESVSSCSGFLSITAVGNIAVSVARTLPPTTDTNSTHLIIIDRAVDLMTPLFTQMNYEGLISEFLGIDAGTVTSTANNQTKLQLLSSMSDDLFGVLRSMTHTEATEEMENRMNQVTGSLSQRSGSFDDGLRHFRDVASLTLANQTLTDHLTLAQKVFQLMKENRFFQRGMNAEGSLLANNPTKAKEAITDMFDYGSDLRPLIRLICLDSLLKGGTADFARDIQLLTFNYGFAMVPFLMRLQEIGLFVPNGSGFKWGNFVKTFSLFVPDWEGNKEGIPRDEAAAAYLGYAPLSVRIVEKVVAGELAMVTKAMQDIGQRCSESGSTEIRVEVNYIVCFIGGCTYSEVNSIRRIARVQGTRFQVITTNMFSSNEFFDNLAYEIPFYDPIVTV
jgi:hypothetical protein